MTRPAPAKGVPRYRETFRPLGPLPTEVKDRLRAAARERGFDILDDALEPIRPPSALPASHPVARLLANPPAIVADREQWPTADDLEAGAGMLATVWAAWLKARASQVGGPWSDPSSREASILEAVKRWPAPWPVGRDCPEWATVEAFAVMRDLMPFSGDLHAVLILPGAHNGRAVVWFVLSEQVPVQTVHAGDWLDLPGQWSYTGTMRSTVDGKPRARTKAWSWVQWLAGRTIGDGQARGGPDWTPEAFVAELLAYCQANGTEPPRCEDFLSHLWPDLSSPAVRLNKWRRLAKDWNLRWGELRAMVYGG